MITKLGVNVFVNPLASTLQMYTFLANLIEKKFQDVVNPNCHPIVLFLLLEMTYLKVIFVKDKIKSTFLVSLSKIGFVIRILTVNIITGS